MGLISNGTTLLDAGAISAAKGALTLIKTLTASSSATLSFLDGTSDVVFDGTYKEYIFKFYDIHAATDETQFMFQTDTGTNTSYNQTITSSFFRSKHNEADGGEGVEYKGEQDQAQGTAFQKIAINLGTDNDQSAAGTLQIFDPADSTFVKHFYSVTNTYRAEDLNEQGFCAGYVNTTTALTRVQFKMSSGNIDAGTIKLYGVT